MATIVKRIQNITAKINCQLAKGDYLMSSNESAGTSAQGQNSPLSAVRTIVLGSESGKLRREVRFGLVPTIFASTFLAYELGIFYDSGGLVWIPFHAAIVGMVAAFWTGYRRNGLFFGWVLTYVPLLSWRAEWATETSARTLTARIRYIVRLDALLMLALIGIVVALLGFMAGVIVRRSVDTVRVGD